MAAKLQKPGPRVRVIPVSVVAKAAFMAGQGKTGREIERGVSVPETTIRRALDAAGVRILDKAPGERVYHIKLTRSLRSILSDAARMRGIPEDEMAETLMRCVVEAGLHFVLNNTDLGD